ncbi:MAG TPA: homoserine O-succinyltransferase [Steroidobacteraceae bacterium]|nr:homoserine O-succinyltransferase [Steroidobacteraceae bacterium]
MPKKSRYKPGNRAARPRGRDLLVREEVLRLPAPWRLHHGDELPNAHIAFRVEGPADAPVIAVMGGISAHRIVCGAEGWWPELVGPGHGIDTRQFRVLGIDYLGGRGQSSTPAPGGKFPPLSSYDQAEALHHIVEHLELGSLHAIVGASYGGMVALSFAERHGALVGRIVVLSAADKSQVLSTAWRSVQRQIVREAIARGDGPSGLKLARALAMATYRSSVEFELRFGGAPVRDADRFRFPVEDYLFARGDDYVRKYRAETFLCLSESIDLHRMDATLVRTPATLIAVREDQLVPFGDMQALAARLNGPRELIEINSIFGHDAFLKEGAALTPIIKRAVTEPLI